MSTEGYIKFNCTRIPGDPPSPQDIQEINAVRRRLHLMELIGAYQSGIGYGNISVRVPGSQQFIITGSSTGGFRELATSHYAWVTDFDFDQNKLTCIGQIDASSESLSHAIIYQCAPKINAVIHVHHKRLWDALLGKVPTTSKGVEYGTPQMAREIERLFRETDVLERKILVMEGHEEGIISVGETLAEAQTVLLRNYMHN